jgi:predicted Fe-Mo cluster-binding NifX family protein
MMIALPIHDGRFSTHFGGAEAFALYEIDEASRTISERRMLAPPEHGRGIFPTWLRQQGATVILAGGMGPRAASIFAQHGIEVVLGVHGDDPEALVKAFLAGTLEASGELCQDHGFHDCGHNHSHGGGSHGND